MVRIQYYISFTIIYVLFSMLVVKITTPNVNILWNGRRRINGKGFQNLLLASILIFVSSIRMNTGSDYWSYSLIYNRILSNYGSVGEVIKEGNFSPGINVLSFILKSISEVLNWGGPLEQNFLFIVASIFTTIVTIWTIRKNSADFKISILVYFLMGYYCIANNIIKQQIAMTSLFIAYEKLKEKKYFGYVVMCVIACSFHITAIVPAVIYPLLRIYKTGRKDIYILIGINIAITVALPFASRFFSNFSFLGYTKYFVNFDVYSGNKIGRVYAIGLFIVYFIIFGILYKNEDKLKERSKENNFYLYIIAIGLIFNALAINFWLFVRLSLYFYQFVIIAIPNAVGVLAPRKKTMRCIYIGLTIFCVFYVLFSWDNHYFAYHTVFNEEMVPAYLDTYINLYE